MKKIVIPQNLALSPNQFNRLEDLGDVTYHQQNSKSPEEWLERVIDADIICTGKYGLKNKVYELNNVFISLPFVGVGFLDSEKLKENNITIAYAPGCNRHAVSEWIVGALVNMMRRIPEYSRSDNEVISTKNTTGLAYKKALILGKGHIGSTTGNILESLSMDVEYFERGDDLLGKSCDKDVVINCLSSNESTFKILDAKFFNSLKVGSFFITVTSEKIYDVDAMIYSLDEGVLAGVADDCGSIMINDHENEYFKRLQAHPKIFATPHIAARTDVTNEIAYDMMIDNIENYLNGDVYPKV